MPGSGYKVLITHRGATDGQQASGAHGTVQILQKKALAAVLEGQGAGELRPFQGYLVAGVDRGGHLVSPAFAAQALDALDHRSS